MELSSVHGLCWIFWICVAICATGAHSCIVTAPNVVRLGAEETAVVFNQGPPREVTLTLQDHPARLHTLFRDTISLGTGESRLVRMPIDPQKLSADEIRSGQRRYVSLVVECYALASVFLAVHFRMVAVGEDLAPSIGELKFEVKNPQNIVTYQTVLSAKDNASATGMFSHSYTFPESPILGQWKAVVTYGSYFTQQTEITFEVQEYVLPTFSVTLTTPSVILTEQQYVEGKVEAKYVYGKPVEGSANFRFKIRNEGGTDREIGSTDFKELVRGEATFRISTAQFRAPQRKRWAALVHGNRLVVEAEVLDKATSKRVTAVDESAVFATSPYLVGFRHTPKDFKPGTMTVIVADVTTQTGKPAVGIPCAITVLDDQELDVPVEPTISVTDALGRAAFLVQTGRSHSTIKAKVQTRDLQYKPHQQSEGNIAVQAFNSPVHAFVALKRMDTRKSFKVGEYFDSHVITEPADVSPIFYLVTHRGQTKQRGVLEVSSSLPNRSVHFAVTRDMSPRIRVLVYAFHRGHLLADSLTIQVEEACTESSTITIEPDFANDEPGSNGSLKVLGRSGTRVGILGVDKAVYILNNKGLLTREKLFTTLKSHELGCGPGGGLSSEEVMSNFGAVIISEEGTENVVRTEGSCEARVRHRRSVHQRAQRQFSRDPFLKECCALGQKRDRVGRRCSTRAHIVRRYIEGTRGEECADAFQECCLSATSRPESAPSRPSVSALGEPDDRSKSAVEFTVDDIDEVDGDVAPDTVIRRDFRETWLFDEQVIGPDGVADFAVSLPHSITTWSVQAVSVSPTGGVCVPQQQEVRVFQPIFLQVALPYKVVRNEQIEVLVTVYNYGAESLRGNVYIYGVEGLCTGALPGERSERRPVVVEANSASSVTFPVVPLKEGLFVIKIHVRSSRGEDVVEKELNVVPEGVTVEKSISVPIDPANVRRRRTRSVRGELFQDSLDPGANLQVISVNTRLPPDAIPDTKTCSLSVIGNQIGPSVQTTLENIEDLVTMPTGSLEEKGYRYIREGYQRELSFRKMDGSFSAFKHRKSSVWLTAFVLRIFCKARRYASIDPTVIEKGMLWLSAAQKLDGSFVEKKPIMHKTMLGGVRGAVPMTAFVLLTFNECMRPPSGVAYDKYDIYSTDSKRMSRRSVSNVPGGLFSELGFPGLPTMFDVEEAPDIDKTDDNIWPDWMNTSEDNSSDPVVDETGHESQILGRSAEMAVNYLREHAFESDEPYVAALVAYALSQSNSSEKHAALSALKDRLIHDPMLSTRSTGTEPSALVVEGTAYALLTLADTVVALQALTEFALKSREPNVDLTCNVTLSSQRNFQRSLRLKRDNAAILQQLDIRDVTGKMFVKASGTGSGLLSVKLKYNVLVPPELLCKFNITVRADIRNMRETAARSVELPPDLLKDLLGEFRRRRSITSWIQNDSRSRDYSPASPFFPDESRRFNGGNSDTAAASVQATPQSKLTYDIEVCSRYIGVEDSNMAVIEVGLFSGFEPIKDDLEKARNDSDLLAKYEMTEKNVILYFDKIPWESPTCVKFGIERQHVVYNVQSAVVKVYDYYNPMHSCTQFYGPGSTSPLLKLVCEGNQCQCAAAQCPRKEPFLDVERAGTTLKKRHKLLELVCQQHDFAWIGEVSSNNVINGYRHITFRVDTVIKEGLESSASVMTGKKLFVARELCSTADLIEGERYFVFGRDSEPFEKDGQTIMKYNLDKDVRVVRAFNTNDSSISKSPSASRSSSQHRGGNELSSSKGNIYEAQRQGMQQVAMDFRLTEPHLSPHQQTILARVGLFLLTAIVVLATLALVLTRSRRPVPLPPLLSSAGGRRLRAPARICNASTCHLAAKLLKASAFPALARVPVGYPEISPSLRTRTSFLSTVKWETVGDRDPCDDFYAYVCSGWLQQPSFISTHRSQVALLSGHARSTLRYIAQRYTTPGAPARPSGSPARGGAANSKASWSSSVTTAAMLYDECLKASTDHHVDVLVAFLKDAGLGFSEPVMNPLSKALELDLFYNVKTLFNVHRHPTWMRADGRPLVSLSARQDLEEWRHDRDRMIRRRGYAIFVRSHVGVVLSHENGTDESGNGSRSVDGIVHHIIAMEETVLGLSSAIPEDNPDRYYIIVDLSPQNGSFSSTISSPEAHVIRETAVGHPAMLAYKDFLQTRVPAPELADYVTWEVVRQLGPLADQRLSYGAVEGKCFDAVYHLMPYPSVLPYMEQLDSAKGWEEAELVFRDVTESLIRFMKRRGFELPFPNSSFVLDLPNANQLDAFYARRYSASHTETPHLPILCPPPSTGKAQVSANGKSRAPLTWLLPPRFGADMPPALNDGGLGIDLAASLAKSSYLDHSWLDCLANFEPRADIRGEDFALARLALVAEVVEEFVDLHSELATPLTLPALESLSDEKLFFVGGCVGLCARGDPQAAHRCNVPARNLPHFAATFECPTGSYMNPPATLSLS
ncbi:hypothetical protein MTO96_024211 [Rhipicephalus appendiculatus]